MAVKRTGQCLEDNEYSSNELRLILAKKRGKPVPVDTLKYWRKKLGIIANDRGNYNREDLENLSALVMALSYGYTIRQFVNKNKERFSYAYEKYQGH